MTRPTRPSDNVLAHRVALKLHMFLRFRVRGVGGSLSNGQTEQMPISTGLVETASKTNLPAEGPDLWPLAAVVSHLIYQRVLRKADAMNMCRVRTATSPACDGVENANP